ncbi:MAG: hypothetical protein HKN92_08165 [Chitinophagales bacterium]|nr:hypothetical protein [Chitinophagales bacterium]
MLLSLGVSAIGQNETAIGEWRMHLPYTSSNSVAVSVEKVYSSTGFSVMSFERSDGSLRRLDKVNGLSDIGIDFIKYSKDDGVLFIAYSNSNIDLLFDNNVVVNVSELRNPLILGDKRITDAHFINNVAYITTGIELLLYDLNELEFISNFPLGSKGEEIKLNSVSDDGSYIYVASEEGIKRTLINDPNIADFSTWEWLDYASHKISRDNIDFIDGFKGEIFCSIDDTIKHFDGSNWNFLLYDSGFDIISLNPLEDMLYIVQHQVDGSEFIDHRFIGVDSMLQPQYQKVSGLSRPVGIDESNGVMWIADKFSGLKRFDSNALTTIQLSGPGSTGSFRLNSYENRILVASGGVEETFINNFNQSGLFEYDGISWKKYAQIYPEELKYFYDVLDAEIDPIDESVYFCSFLSGIAHVKDGQIELIDTASGIQTSVGDPSRVKISGLDFDSQGNLWASNFNATDPFLGIDRVGNIYQFATKGKARNFKTLMVDRYDQIWAAPRGDGDGIVILDYENTIDDPFDDQTVHLTKSSGLGDMPNAVVNCMVEDKTGSVWIGTEQGIGIFDCPAFIFEDGGCEPRRVIVERDGFNAFLFETENVRTIAVDGANRKWVGTTNGAWLISESGEEELLQFNTDNSPLPSNNVLSITINDVTGEVFIGTELGVASYKSDATVGGETHENVTVFPNPVSPDYIGPIAIRGLVDEAFVKITDVSGSLIYETPANGGQAIWNGSNLSGERAKSGIYMVFSSNSDGSEKFVAKILLLN